MDINIENINEIAIVKIAGDVDANTASTMQAQVLPLAQPHSKILLDMTHVPYLSSAGLRTLLSLYRQTKTRDGKLVLTGLSEDIRDTMSITGFLDLFITCETLDLGLATLQ